METKLINWNKVLIGSETIANELTVNSLFEITKKYPYFSTAHSVLAKALMETEDAQYNSQLKTAATFSINRKNLYFYLNKNNDNFENTNKNLIEKTSSTLNPKIVLDLPSSLNREIEGNEVTIPPIESPVIESKPLERVIDIESEKIKDGNPLESNEVILNQKQELIIEEPIIEQQQQVSNNVVMEEIPLIEEIPPTLNIIEEKASELMPILKNESIKIDSMDNLDKEILANGIKALSENSLESFVEKENHINPVENSAIEIPKNDQGKNTELSFSDWLKLSDSTQQIQAKENSVTKNKVESNPILPSTSNKKDEKEAEKSILENFIKSEPKITKPKASFYSPVNMAKQSVTDDLNLASETLAKIYLNQGNYSKAIKIYDVLSLKFPEKNLYFAALIKEAKQKQQNKH